MTHNETLKAIALIQECYPHFMDGRTPETTAAIWAKMFPSEEYPRVEAAIMAFVASDVKGYPPGIGQIKEKLAQMEADNELDEAGAWALVAKAMRNGIYGAELEYAALPYEVQKAVGSPQQLRDWAVMDTETVNSVIASNFMRSYRARAGYAREIKKLPDNVRAMYLAAGDAFSIDRALPAPKTPKEPVVEPEPTVMPEVFKAALAGLKSQVERDKVEAAKKQSKLMMQRMFGITIGEGDGCG